MRPIRTPWAEAVSAARLSELADPDARENYQVVLAFRDRLAAAGTLEDCYLGIFLDQGGVQIPPLFLDQLPLLLALGVLLYLLAAAAAYVYLAINAAQTAQMHALEAQKTRELAAL